MRGKLRKTRFEYETSGWGNCERLTRANMIFFLVSRFELFLLCVRRGWRKNGNERKGEIGKLDFCKLQGMLF